MEQQGQIFEQDGFNEVSRAYLLETVRWTKFLAIMGFIFIGIFIVIALFIMMLGSTFSPYSSGLYGMGLGIGMGLFYLLIAALYIYPVLSLMKFSSCMKRGLNNNNQELITQGFRHQKNMYKFMGVMMIIMIALYLVGFLFMGVAGLMSR